MLKLISLLSNGRGLAIVLLIGIALGGYVVHLYYGNQANSKTTKTLTTIIETGDKVNVIKNNTRSLPDGAASKRLSEQWQRD